MMPTSQLSAAHSKSAATRHPAARSVLLILIAIGLSGCQSLRRTDAADFPAEPLELIQSNGEQASDISTNATPPSNTPEEGVSLASGLEGGGVVTAGAVETPGQGSGVVQADGDAAVYTDPSEDGNRVVSFLTSWRENPSTAKSMYQQADRAFKAARKLPKTQATKSYADAAKFFRKAGSAAPGSALQQDALYMQAESHFFADEYNDATKAYQKLQKDFPRNKHSDHVSARLFQIGKYWIATSRANGDAWYKLNLFDDKRPGYDSKGHAVKLLDQIRYDDPTGRLADDATMAAAAEYIRQTEFEKADEFLTDLRETFTDSDHLFLAHLLGIRCKLEVYAGPNYSGLVLEEAEELIEQTRQRFPDKLREQQYSELVARASREVTYHQAERLAHRARYRENRQEYGAASSQYRQILRDHPSAPQAKTARARLSQTQKLPSVAEKRLAFLTKVFPDSRQKSPLIPVKAARRPTPSPKTKGANSNSATLSDPNQAPLANPSSDSQPSPSSSSGTIFR